MSCRREPGISRRRGLWALIALSVVSISTLIGQEKGGGDETGAYDVVPGWLKPPTRRAGCRVRSRRSSLNRRIECS